MSLSKIRRNLRFLADREHAEILANFFKTGKGEYAEGDKFIGVRVPSIRRLAGKLGNVDRRDLADLLESPIHEERMLALIIMVNTYKKAGEAGKKRIYSLYMRKIRFVNNWDLVDCSAEHIVGAFLVDKDKDLLYKLAESGNLWSRRIAIISTFHYIKMNSFVETLNIAKMLINDAHDLIHKAVGWMLREVGKRNLQIERTFLRKHYKQMPRTMLRYAIERFPEGERKRFLNS